MGLVSQQGRPSHDETPPPPKKGLRHAVAALNSSQPSNHGMARPSLPRGWVIGLKIAASPFPLAAQKRLQGCGYAWLKMRRLRTLQRLYHTLIFFRTHSR
jgi:hypothetical protein